MSEKDTKIASSFRDPSGFLFKKDGLIFRQINSIYKENYEHLIRSGLYKELVGYGLLIAHNEADINLAKSKNAYKILRPKLIQFISYPYEWCFSQLKDAALTTLEIQKRALNFGMTLKDASAYNIQFSKGEPVFIDILSFEKHSEGEPWVAYRQFCQHFLGPLVLMSYSDIGLSQLLRIYIDGLPLDLVSPLLPIRSWLRPSLFLHLHLHAQSQKYFASRVLKRDKIKKRFSRRSFSGLIDGLESLIKQLTWRPKNTEWRDYYEDDSYKADSFEHKKKIVGELLEKIKPKNVWDLGANIGLFSQIASNKGIPTISFDVDYSCVETNYLNVQKKKEKNILPLYLDLTNPSPALGWENRERMSLLERGPADTVMALALTHHLALSNNLPLEKIADFFRKICHSLIIEFIPKSDPNAQKLLAMKGDIFPHYTQENFEQEFSRYFRIENFVRIKGSQRGLYLMVKK